MKRLALVLVLAVPLAAAADLDTGRLAAPHPDAPPEMAQFAFLVGEWDCKLTSLNGQGQRVESTGRWVGYYTLGGYAFQDDWYAASGSRGTTWRSYHPFKKKWVNTWLMANTDRAPGFAEGWFYGTWQDGEMRLQASGSDTIGDFVDRIVFTEIEKDSFTWKMDRSYDGGESWIEGVAVNRATRVKRGG